MDFIKAIEAAIDGKIVRAIADYGCKELELKVEGNGVFVRKRQYNRLARTPDWLDVWLNPSHKMYFLADWHIVEDEPVKLARDDVSDTMSLLIRAGVENAYILRRIRAQEQQIAELQKCLMPLEEKTARIRDGIEKNLLGSCKSHKKQEALSKVEFISTPLMSSNWLYGKFNNPDKHPLEGIGTDLFWCDQGEYEARVLGKFNTNKKETVKMKKDAIYVLDENQKFLTTGRVVKSSLPILMTLPSVLEFNDEAEAKARIRRVGDLRKPYHIIKVIDVVECLPDIVEVKDDA